MNEAVMNKSVGLTETSGERVTRVGSEFVVTTPDGLEFRLWKDEAGAVRCTCGRADASADGRCPHMIAVRAAIRSKMTEPTRARETGGRGNVVDFAVGRGRHLNHAAPVARTENAAEFDTSELDKIDPHWKHSVRDFKQVGNFFVVTVAVTANGISREGIGTGIAADPRGIATAETLALANAVRKFRAEERGAPRPPVEVFPSNPIARSLFDLVTGSQLRLIRGISRDLGIIPDDECERLMNCRTDELSKAAASRLIQHLEARASESSYRYRRAG